MAIVHKFEMNGMKMVLDANSGAFHIVDGLTYRILDYYKKMPVYDIVKALSKEYDKNDIIDACSELKELENDGLLYTEDKYKDIVLKNNQQSYIKAMCLNISHDCNLRCKYCFASKGDYRGKRELMPESVGKAAIDFIIKNSGPRKNLEIDLFGGEPLMNFNVVKSVVSYGKSLEKKFNKSIRFTITTNATLLNDEIIDFLDKNMVNIVLSIDGRKNINDAVRVRVDGSGTYDDILPKIKKMVSRRSKGKQYYVRGTFTSQNLDFYNDVMELANSGFKEISIEPVVLPEDDPLSLKRENLGIIFKQYEKIANEILRRNKEGNGFKFYHFAIDINGGPCIYKRVSGCGAGFEYIAVTPNGDIYPCHQFVGNEKYKMGTVFDGIKNKNIGVEFKKGHIYNKPKCMDCWAKFYCSGGCQANNYNFNGNILEPYAIGCELQKKRIECALMIKAAQQELV
ncbi:MAG TPA: thioether cross-link-forming SCIFF peptide maturase [Clostridiaceae bacterium]|nr:thioether cross-link-forming SCIFF peptide maturase [Clostridiaceae bacterium]